MASFRDFFLGKPEKTQNFSPFSPEQQQFLKSLLGQLGGPLSQGLGNISNILSNNPEAYRDFERPAMRQFNEEILPSIAEGFGGLGAASSSGAQQTFARAGERLSENLAAQRAGLQQNSIQQLLGFLGSAMPQTNQTYISPGTSGFLGGILPGIGSGGSLGLLKLLGVF